jgi:hypothetical protein
VVIHQLDDGRWHVVFPDGLTALVVDDRGVALAGVPTGWPFEIHPATPA